MQLRRLLTFGGVLFALTLSAQSLDLKPFKNIKPRNIGPAGMSGRITAIDVVQAEPDHIYVGTASGGVWKSESGGITWTPIFDDQPIQSIGALAINQSNPSDLWVGTGEGNPRNSQNFGLGIFRSLDGGKTWKNMGLKETKTIHRIIIHRDNPNVVYAGAQGSSYGPNEERGVYRTKDGGKTWERILYVNNETGVADMVVDPSNPNKIIVAMWEYGRKPWTFNSGGAGSGLYVTHDGGDTWERRSDADGLPKGNLGRMGLAISRSKPNIVYALVEAKDNALYKSTDGGKKWSVVATKNIGDRPFYYAEIYVDPQNENRLWNIFSLVTKSEDGGKTFETVLPYSGVHPDHHAFWIHPNDPNYIIDGNDGGLNISHDGGKSWRFIDNIPVGQFYHVNYDMSIPYKIGGGMQDNGSWVGPSAVWQQGGIRNTHWQEVFFGDGFDLGFRPDNSRYIYAMSQGGNVGYVDTETGKINFIKPTSPNSTELRFNWNAAFAQDPHNNCGVYYGSQFVHYSKDCGQSWEIISPDLTTNDTAKQKPQLSGGLTLDATNAENHTTILAIAPSALDAKVIWVGTDDGNLQLTRDGGKTWTNLISKLPGYKAASWIPYIEPSPHNAGEAFVIVNDYRRNDWRPMLYHTADYGQTFTKIADENKVSGHTLCVVQDPIVANLLFLGTDQGLFLSIDKGVSWTKWTNGYPSVPTADLKIHPRDHDLIIGTFGRAFWILDDIRPLREVARTGGKVLEQSFKIFPIADAYQAAFKSYDGYHFPADGLFIGENKAPGAWITFWTKPSTAAKPAPLTPPAPATPNTEAKKSKKVEPAKPAAPSTDTAKPSVAPKEEKRPERVKIIILGSAGDTVRTFSARLDTGMAKVYWPLNRNGTRQPSRQERRPDEDAPFGPQVLPGTYKVVAVWGKLKDSTTVNVKSDPRLNVKMDDLKAKDAAFRDLEKIVKKASEGFDQIKEARATVRRVDAALANAPDSTKQKLAKLGKTIQDSLNLLEKLYMEPEDVKGIQRNDNNLTSALGRAQQYINAGDGTPNQGAQRMIAAARQQSTAVLNRLNKFFNTSFAEYRKKVEEVQYSLFKAYTPLKIE
jgi:photosystem II stability/assembly factor-like uncharacterized protein